MTTHERARQLYITALEALWRVSSSQIQLRFPKDEFIRGKGKIYERTTETIAKMSTAQKGKQHSEETKARIGAAHAGKPLSEEHKSKISAAKMRHEVKPETRAKISAAQRRRREGERVKGGHVIFLGPQSRDR